MKKKANKNQEAQGSRSGYVSLAEFGDALRKKNPDMMKKVEAFQSSDKSLLKIIDVIYDLFPYSWDDPELFEQGVEQIYSGHYSAAIESFKEVLRQRPDCYPACHLMGVAYGYQKNYKQEIECYRKTVKIRPDYPQVYFNVALVYWFQGKEKKAFAEFKRAVPLALNFAVAEFWLNFTLERLGRSRAVENPGESRGRHSQMAMAYGSYLLGLAYLEYGLHIAARHGFKKAAQLLPEFAEAQYQLGLIHVKRLRNPKRAEKYLERAEQLFAKQGDLQRAALVHQILNPQDLGSDGDKAAEDWLKEGLRLQQLERYQGAIDAYKMAIHHKPNFVDAFYNLGIAYGSLEDTGLELIHKAIWVFRKVIEIKPDFVHAYSALGASCIKLREYAQAVEVLRDALRLEQKEPTVFYYLGIACRMLGDIGEAEEFFRKAVHLNPSSIQAQYYLGLTLMDLQRYPDACEVFQEVVHIKPDFADAHFLLANIYMEKIGDQDKAVAHLKKAEKLFIKLEDNHRLSQVRQMLSHLNV